MPRSALLALLLAVMAGGAAWILLGPDSSPDALRADVGEESSELDENRAEAETTNVAADPVEVEELDRVSVAESPIAEAAPATTYLAHFEGENALRVKVVDEESDEPVPGASVYIIEREDIDEGELERAFTSGESTLQQLAVRYGKAYKTNKQGIAVVPPVTEFPFLFASMEDRFGMTWRVEEGENETVVRIQPERWLEVTIVDVAGKPAAKVPVTLRMVHDDYSFDMMSRMSDENGVTEMRNLGPYLDSAMDNGMANLYVAVGIPMKPEDQSERTQVKLDEETLAAHSAVLTMPHTGSVDVRVLRPDGARFEGEGTVALWSNGNQRMGRGDSSGTELVDGVAHFPHVGLGAKIQAVLMVPGGSSNDTLDFDGPTLSSQKIEVDMLREERVIVVGTLVDDSDVALANTEIQLRYRMQAGWNRRNDSASTETDENGRFSYELPLLDKDEEDEREHSLTVSIEQESGPKHEALFQLPAQMHIGEHDLGKVKLVKPPLAVSGVVVNEAGEALENARLSMSKLDANDDEHVRRYARHYGDLGLHARTDEEGKFELYHELPKADEYLLHARVSGYEETSVSMLPGQSDLNVVLKKASYVEGEVLLDADFPRGQLNIQAELPDGNSNWTGLSRADDEDTWKFRTEIEAHKSYDIVITSDTGAELHRESGVMAGSGETVRPPNMQPLDLRGKVNLIKIEVFSPSGDALPFGVAIKNGNSTRMQDSDKDGLTLISTEAVESVQITSPGYASKTIENVQSDQRVVLEAATEIFIEIPTEFVNYRGLGMTVTLRPASGGRSRSHYNSQGNCTFDASGRGTMMCDGPGTYRVIYRLTNSEGSSRRSSSFGDGEVQVSSAGQVIRLNPPRDRIDQLANNLLDDH